MNYKLLFLDYDGTLKQEPNEISRANKEAILSACQAGKKVSIASGRNKDLIMHTVKELQLDKFGESYTVALNGAHIFENCSGTSLHSVPIPLNLTYLLFKKAYELEITCHVYTENYIYFNYHDDQFKWYQEEGCTCELIDMEQPGLGLKQTPLKFYLFSKDTNKLNRYKEEMDAVTKEDMNAEYSSRFSLEYTSTKASKGLGIEFICQQFGLTMDYAIAAGDGENDISMIQMAGLGVAMKNALDSVKAVADTITERTCMEDGVSEIINRYLLG